MNKTMFILFQYSKALYKYCKFEDTHSMIIKKNIASIGHKVLKIFGWKKSSVQLHMCG